MCVVFPWCSELRVRVAGGLSWRGSSPFCDISRDMRLDLPATTGLLRARTGSCRQFECTRNLIERRLLRFAYAHAADAKKSALLGGLRNVLADLAQPTLEGRCIAGRLGIDYRTSLPQRVNALGFDLGGLAACELLLEAVARNAPSVGSLEVGNDCFDQRVRTGVQFGRHQRLALRETLFQKAPQTAGLGSRDGNPRRHDALKKKLPFVGGEVRLVRHGPTPLLKLGLLDCGYCCINRRHPRRRLMNAAGKSQAVSAASFVRRASIVGFNSSATPGIASTLSNSWLSEGISGFTTPASTFRCSGDNCPSRPSTLSIWAVTSRNFGSAAWAEEASVMPASVVRKLVMLSVTCLPISSPPTVRPCTAVTPCWATCSAGLAKR